MPQETEPSQAAAEAAVEETLRGWAAELYTGQKFWWMDWDRLILDVRTALRTGEPVGIDDYGEGDVRPEWGAVQPLVVEPQENRPTCASWSRSRRGESSTDTAEISYTAVPH